MKPVSKQLICPLVSFIISVGIICLIAVAVNSGNAEALLKTAFGPMLFFITLSAFSSIN